MAQDVKVFSGLNVYSKAGKMVKMTLNVRTTDEENSKKQGKIESSLSH